MSVYCKNCKKLMSFTRFYCGAVNESKGYERAILNLDNDCQFYEKTWWRFWVKALTKEDKII